MLNGKNVLQVPPVQEIDQICAYLEVICEQTPSDRILLVLANSRQTSVCTRRTRPRIRDQPHLALKARRFST